MNDGDYDPKPQTTASDAALISAMIRPEDAEAVMQLAELILSKEGLLEKLLGG